MSNDQKETTSGRSIKVDSVDRRTVLTGSLSAAIGSGIFAGMAGLEASSFSGIEFPNGMRRIVTGHDADGQSYVVSDERISGGTFPNLFSTTNDDPFGPGPETMPRELRPTDSPRLEPTVGGANFVFVALPPTSPDAPLGWHRTETVDINVLLSGELILVLDKEEVTVHPGDAVIQRNTMHAWKNPTNTPVHWVAVLVPIRQKS